MDDSTTTNSDSESTTKRFNDLVESVKSTWSNDARIVYEVAGMSFEAEMDER